ncbi:MAG TPA: TlpA disulfide reductase family protein [Gaiellaceae bacterium]|jgi:cytochrome c biogenesis protein CcmG/thiol:disulfide interchange protein DsbE|nr:TlpA disulfide reductase family protein [Gaiellaceae bacterium]
MTDAANSVDEQRSPAGRQLRRVGTVLALALVAGLLALLVYRLSTQESAKGFVNKIAAGDDPAAPGFSLKPLSGDGGPVKLASFRGKAVVVNWWASWCQPCKKEAPLLQQAYRRWHGQGVVFLGVDANDVTSDGRSFVAKHGLGFTMLKDGSGSTLGHWGITGFPETFFIDRQGRAVDHIGLQIKSVDQIDAGIRKALG